MIREFQGENRWLSNFWPAKVVWEGVHYFSVENAYVAAKSSSIEEQRRIAAMSPGQAQRYGRSIEPADWESRKVAIMKELLRIKFANPELRRQLLATGTQELQEGNLWGDVFWGVDLRTGKGLNTFGKLLMEVRQEIQNAGR